MLFFSLIVNLTGALHTVKGGSVYALSHQQQQKVFQSSIHIPLMLCSWFYPAFIIDQ